MGQTAITFCQAHSYPRNPYDGCYQFRCLVYRGMMGVNSRTVELVVSGCLKILEILELSWNCSWKYWKSPRI